MADDAAERGPDPRRYFADQLRTLFAAAGGPALKKVVSEATALGRSLGNDRTVSVQRISDWRSGKRLPASFESVHPVLVVLIRAARNLNSEPPAPGLYSLKQWEKWWTVAKGEGPTTRAVEKTPAVVLTGIRPYRGLAAYREHDARLFFGRTRSVDRLTDIVLAAYGQGPVIVTGPSGVGKSSLVQAGLAPRLCNSGDCAAVVVTPASGALDRLLTSLPALADVTDPSDQARIHTAVRAEAERRGVSTLLIIVDQIEELFTQCADRAERLRFLDILERASTGLDGEAPAHVVATMRSDFYEQAVTYPVLARALERRSKTVQPLDHDDLVDVITEPAKLLGVRFEPGLVDLILHDLGFIAPGHLSTTELPLLSHVLDTMWDTRSGGTLTTAGYRATGGVRGSIAAAAERAWEHLDDHDREIARAVMVHLVYVTDTGTDVKMGRPLDELLHVGGSDRAAVSRVVDHFVKARVLVVDTGRIELIHDAVIDAWPRLKSWLQDSRSYAATRQRVEADAASWIESGRNKALLYPQGRMELLTELDTRFIGSDMATAVSPVAGEFLEASDRQVRRTAGLRGSVIVGMSMLTIIALVMGTLAFVAKGRAESERSSAQFQQMIALSDSMRADDPTMSAHLALAAVQMRPDSDVAYSRLVGTDALPLARTLNGHDGPIYGVDLTDDGNMLASASDDGTIRLWALDDGGSQVGASLVSSEHYMASVSFGRDDRYLAAGGGNGGVWMWDLADPTSPQVLLDGRTFATDAVYNVRFSPDGQRLAAPYDDGTVALIDTSDLQFPAQLLPAHEGAVRTVAWRPDGAVIATASDDRTVRLWDVPDPDRTVPLGEPLTGFGDVAHSVSFDPTGTRLAVSSDDGVLWMFDTTDPAAVHPIGSPTRAHAGGVWSISFLPDGRTLASASWDGTAKLWAVDEAEGTLEEITPALNGHGGGATSIAIASDGDTIVTGGQDSNLRIWTMPEGRISVDPSALTAPAVAGDLVAVGGYNSAVKLWQIDEDGWHRSGQAVLSRPFGGGYNSELSSDGTLLATAATSGGSVQLWDVSNPDNPGLLTDLPLGTRFTSAVAFGPGGRILVTGHDDQTVQLWDLTDPTTPTPLSAPLDGPTNFVRNVAIGPTGQTLAAASADGDLYAWDISDPTTPTRLPITGAHSAGVNDLAFGPGGTTLVTGGDDHDVIVWNRVVDGGFVARDTVLRGHSGTVYSVAYSPGGEYVVSGADDGTVRLWNVANGDRMRAVGGPLTESGVGRVRVAFLREGVVLASGGDGMLRTWNLDADRVAQRVCSSTVVDLSKLLPQHELPVPEGDMC